MNEYRTQLCNNISNDYRKMSECEILSIDQEAALIARQLDIEWRVDRQACEVAFLTVKDHKDDFPKKIAYRLINPAKSEIGRVSKIILQRINNEVRNHQLTHQVRSTAEVLNWYHKLNDKKTRNVIHFDIDAFT